MPSDTEDNDQTNCSNCDDSNGDDHGHSDDDDDLPMESGDDEEEEEEEEEQEENDEEEDKDREEEIDEDNDDESSLSEDSDDVNSDNNDVDQSRDNKEDGISEYERLRLERIKRNQERLKQLGLHGHEGHGVLGGRQPNRHKRKKKILDGNTTAANISEQRQRLSRKSKTKQVDYTGDLNLRALMDAEKEAQRQARLERKRNQKPRKDKSHDTRVPLFIYHEFQRIKSSRKEHVKQANKHIRRATREIKYWQQQVSFITNKEKAIMLREKLLRQQQLERSLLNGKTQHQVLQELDQRLPELQEIVQKYDKELLSVEQQQRQQQLQIEEWNKKQALDRKLQVIDALESFPRLMNDATATLNALLLNRSPKDPPPPRRSKRSSTDDYDDDGKDNEGIAPKKKRAKTKSAALPPSQPDNVDASWSNLTASLAIAAAARDTSKTTTTTMNTALVDAVGDNATTDSKHTTVTTKKKRPKDARNIGGWISPIFSQQLDRSWLERTKPLKPISIVPPTAVSKGSAMTVFDLNAYVPQPGEIVLYYPSAYRDFLQVHPDTLGSRMRNLLRVPLWVRARRQLGRLRQGTGSDEDQKLWFTEEWILSLTGKTGDDTGIASNAGGNVGFSTAAPTLGDYPIICQVTRTHTEFPPDPYSKEKSVSKSGKETTISWAQPPAAKLTVSKQRSDRPQVRLVVTLKPLSKVISPNFDNRLSPYSVRPSHQSVDDHTFVEPTSYADLAFPPNFSVVTCPVTAPLEPIMVPFCYAYATYHSLSVSQSVWIRRAENDAYHKDDSKTKRAGKSPLVHGKGRVFGFAAAREPQAKDPTFHVNHLAYMNDLNPMMYPSHGFELGEDPFGLNYSLGTYGFSDVHAALGAEGLGGDATELQQHLYPQRTVVTRSFRLEDRPTELEGLLSKLSANGMFLPQALEEALAADDASPTLPVREAGIIVDFLAIAYAGMKNKKSGVDSVLPSTNVSLMQFIQSTLPIRQGVTVSMDSNRRHTHRTSPWHLVPFHPTEFVRNMQHGFLGTLDNATREKALMGLEDLVESHKPNSDLFHAMVTEDVAPGYYCAVPVAMFFERIFARLKANASGQCYYSSTESISMDLTTISENCMLFNSPESDLVGMCNGMITDCKKFIADLSKSASDGMTKRESNTATMKKRSAVTIPDDLNAPYKGKLHRDWIQRIAPDSFEDGKVGRWIPQSGDHVLYSRSRHKVFISAHMNSLAEIQCRLPKFMVSSASSNEGNAVSTSTDLEASTMSHWLKGVVISVRTTFPLAPTGKVAESFDQPAPILAVEIQLNYSWCKDTIVVFWRPCMLSHDDYNSGIKCQSCMLSQDSFLQPEWTASKTTTVLDSGSSLMDVPGYLDQEGTTVLNRCFDLLLRRSLVGIPPSYVNPEEALSSAERNVAVHPGSRNLPSFEDFLLPAEPGKKLTNTRGVKKSEDPGVLAALAECGILPPWTSEYAREADSKGKHLPKHEAFMPFPSLCLELVRMRIHAGYYRNVLAVVNDISESYVTSVLYILSGPASRKTNRLSIRKIAKYLASARGSPKMSKLYYKRKKSSGDNDSPPSNSKPSKAKQDSSGVLVDFSQEEMSLIGRISLVRSFHAIAIVFATQAKQMERLFCLRSVSVVPPPDLPVITPVKENGEYSQQQLEGIDKIRWVLQAIGREPSLNRISFAHVKKYKLKVSCGGKIITANGDLETVADGVTYVQPSSVLACTSEGSLFRLEIRCGDETIYGERRPAANALENADTATGSEQNSLEKIRDGISLGFHHFEENDGLTRALLGLPGRRFPCVRCQANGLSTLMCRVRKGHSNLDFSIIENFQGTGGVDSLFLPWKSEQDAVDQSSAPEKIEEVIELKDGGDAKDLEEEEKKAEAKREQRATEAKENLVKAQSALKMAQYLSVQAHRLNELEVKLSDDFIRDNFPIDSEDNHYEFCIQCGTAGNLLLCEGCSNVSHPQCAGLSGIPDGDWYCARCVLEKDLPAAVQLTSEESSGKPPATSDCQADATLKALSFDKEATSLPKESDEDEKKGEEVTDHPEYPVEQPLIDSIPSDTIKDSIPTVRKNDDILPDGSVASPAVTSAEPKKKVPPPEITDEEFEARESELYELIEGLSCQHEAPKPKTKSKVDHLQEDDGDDDREEPRPGRKRGRPRKCDTNEGSGRGGSGSGDPMEALSDAARSFLKSLSITTCTSFLAAGSTRLGEDLIKWRKKQGMPPLKGVGHVATISGWKSIVRNAGATEPLSDDSEEFAEVAPQVKREPRSSIERRAVAAAAMSPSPRGKKGQRSKRPGRPKTTRSDNPIENLPAQGQSFCEFIKITDAEEFLSRRTSELGDALVKFREKAKMPALNGSGPSAYVAMWKKQLRHDMAYQKSLEKQRTSRRGRVERVSKVQDVEVVWSSPDEAKRVRRSSNSSKKTTAAAAATQLDVSNTAPRAKRKDESDAFDRHSNDADTISFNVLEETQKLALEEEEPSETPGKRRRLRTSRYAPSR